MEPSIPPEVARSLGYYVYLYVAPRTGRPFYVGKGKDDRVLKHLLEQAESSKGKVLEELRGAGLRACANRLVANVTRGWAKAIQSL